jgi:hypothetical protein
LIRLRATGDKPNSAANFSTSRAAAALVEAFERVRNKGRQTVVVQHVYRGGQAVGAVTK